jgi:hypothetical protein
MAPEITANAIVAAVSAGAEAIDKLDAAPDSGGRRHMVLEELKAINSISDPKLVSIALIHAARTTL